MIFLLSIRGIDFRMIKRAAPADALSRKRVKNDQTLAPEYQ